VRWAVTGPWTGHWSPAVRIGTSGTGGGALSPGTISKGSFVGSVIKKRRKRMAKKKHRKLLKKTRVQRRRLGK
jgi:hypothetical protein